jgi:hypothetical protein
MLPRPAQVQLGHLRIYVPMESNFIENGAVFVKISKIDGFAGSSKTGRLNLNF